MHKLYRVTSCKIVAVYTLHLCFDDGSEQTINFETVLHGNLYGPLRDNALFNQVQLDPEIHTITWPNGAGFDPETLRNWPLYEKSWIHFAQQHVIQPV